MHSRRATPPTLPHVRRYDRRLIINRFGTFVDAHTKFLAPDAVRATFEIVQQVIHSSRPERVLTSVEVNSDKAIALFLFCVGLGFALLPCIYAIHHFWPIPVLATLALGVTVGTEIVGLLSLVAIVAQAVPMLNRIRKT